ncbi:vitamin B12 transporter [Bathymodiolus japonicus methanotrophic gill symbiont]|uniref:TonB-dependent receptor domain-containing protein n=1 Tax=Bathymodiolus japonicus methanotrophic gill symbiont TaxID=113269 RepID=UPI001B5C8155|nr:TonB-dependent receptor [Bathymodiolus japonicus methanotrophic gill symbiont]GFO72635.1 vitamin B12 transporter [Bathymodiolus japonicus methanotrophic gill symbiont]
MKKSLITTPFLLSTLSPIAYADDNIRSLTPLTVTATRSEHDSRLVSSTVITRQDIERKQLNTIEQALHGVAGINITNTGGLGKTTSIFMRGTESDHVLALIDGVRAGSATTGGAAWQHLPISEIESIEVIRGPKSSIYGADAVGGIIHIHTRNATSSDSTVTPAFTAGVGTYAHYKLGAGVSGAVDKAWYNVHISYQQSEGFNSCAGAFGFGCFTNEPDRDGYENYAGTLRLGYQLTDWLTIEGHALYSGGETEFDGSFVNKTDFGQLTYGGKATIQAMDFWRIDLTGGESQDNSTNFLNGTKKSVFDTSRVSFSALNNFSITDKHLISLGYDFQNDSIDSTTSYAETSRYNHAVFIQYQGELANNQFTLAYRSDFNQQFGQNSTWNASWGYAFDNGILVSASYGTAFKAPTFNELYFPGFGNSNLNPEKSESYEIGVSGEHFDWEWSLNGYLTYIDNLIAFDSAIFAPNNISKARIMGIEAIMAGRFYGFDLQLNYSALNPKSLDSATFGNILPRRAQQIFRFDIDRQFGNASVGTTLNVEGHRFDDLQNTRYIDGFVTWDLRAEYQFFEQVVLQGAINNILNTQYQTVAGYNTLGLNVFFNVRYTPSL